MPGRTVYSSGEPRTLPSAASMERRGHVLACLASIPLAAPYFAVAEASLRWATLGTRALGPRMVTAAASVPAI